MASSPLQTQQGITMVVELRCEYILVAEGLTSSPLQSQKGVTMVEELGCEYILVAKGLTSSVQSQQGVTMVEELGYEYISWLLRDWLHPLYKANRCNHGRGAWMWIYPSCWGPHHMVAIDNTSHAWFWN